MITPECTHPAFVVYVDGALTEEQHARLKSALDAQDVRDQAPAIMPENWRYEVVECSWCRRKPDAAPVDMKPLLEFAQPPSAVKA